MLARAETERYKFKILGVTDRCSGCAPRDFRRAQHDGRDGHDAATRQRVENARVVSCPLRGASACGKKGVHEHARLVRIEAQSHLKDCMSSLVVCVNVAGSAMGAHSGRNERRERWHTASKHASL